MAPSAIVYLFLLRNDILTKLGVKSKIFLKFVKTSSNFASLLLSCFPTDLDKIHDEMKDFFVFFKMAPSAIFYLFSFRSSVLTKIEGYFNFYTCEMMIFCEQNLICATLKLRPNSLPRPRGLQFICLERKTLLDGEAKWIVSVYLTSNTYSVVFVFKLKSIGCFILSICTDMYVAKWTTN